MNYKLTESESPEWVGPMKDLVGGEIGIIVENCGLCGHWILRIKNGNRDLAVSLDDPKHTFASDSMLRCRLPRKGESRTIEGK